MSDAPHPVSERDRIVQIELVIVCTYLNRHSPNTRAALALRHLATKALENETWNPTTKEMAQELPWMLGANDQEEYADWLDRRVLYLRKLKSELREKLVEYYQTDEGKAAKVKFSIPTGREWRPIFDHRLGV